MDTAPDDAIARVREICLALPGATERCSHGSASFFAGKQFVSIDDHHHGAEHLAFWCPAPPGAQEALVARDPARFFRPPYVGHRGWVGVRIDDDPDWDEAELLIRDAYRQIAPKRLLAQLDAGTGATTTGADSADSAPDRIARTT
ncbi:MAG: MmcQ/YjbR family DNA-binding protein [Jatrophihabitans sp.]|uniref:MmcQ/YjbR family DNA-binding protein n=1 Tax=Jatrophihabitans sp. TaxID=1932789 RepID=UPI003F7CFE72